MSTPYYSCTSALSRYTNTLCEKLGNVAGCYLVKNVNQYRSCAEICNSITSATEEENCNRNCPVYLRNLGGCDVVTSTESTSTFSTPSSVTSSTTTAVTSAAGVAMETADADNYMWIAVGVAVVIVLIVLGLVCRLKCWQNIKNLLKKMGAYCWNKNRGNHVQLSVQSSDLNADVESCLQTNPTPSTASVPNAKEVKATKESEHPILDINPPRHTRSPSLTNEVNLEEGLIASDEHDQSSGGGD